MRHLITTLARTILWIEPLILAAVIAAFWFPSPLRDSWHWLLLLFIPTAAARYMVYGYLLPKTPIDLPIVTFFVLGIVNVYAAPFTRGLGMLARPLLGAMIYYVIVHYRYVKYSIIPNRSTSMTPQPDRAAAPQDQFSVKQSSDARLLLIVTMVSLLIGVLALGATQWNEKSDRLEWITERIPRIEGFPGAERGFNANEIAGALAWLTPLMAGLAVYQWRTGRARFGASTAFLLLFVAVFLGQSRLAVVGVLIGLALVIVCLIPRGRWQIAAWAALILVSALQLQLSFNPSDRERLAERDERSLTGRIDIWRSSLWIIGDYPYTGVGMNMFRDSRVRTLYPVPRYEDRVLPHAHNEVFQIGADMGIPGIIVLVMLYSGTGYMLWRIWRGGDLLAHAASAGTAAGLLAHLVFGIGDAIPFWDRLSFFFWMMLGLIGAQYIRTRSQPRFKQT